jgi:hypothetical protein
VSPLSINNDIYGEISVGTVLTWTKSYTEAELRKYQALVGKPDHPVPEHLPYLLVLAPLTKLGGDLDYLSGRMEWTVARPVRRDEAVTAELEVTRLESADGMPKIAFDARLRCGDELVVTGRSSGFVASEQGSDRT